MMKRALIAISNRYRRSMKIPSQILYGNFRESPEEPARAGSGIVSY
jgi:hypothetical protein